MTMARIRLVAALTAVILLGFATVSTAGDTKTGTVPTLPGPGQYPGQLPTQLPGQYPGQLPIQLPGQAPGQLPPVTAPQVPGSLPDTGYGNPTPTGTLAPASGLPVGSSPQVVAPPVTYPQTGGSQFTGFAIADRSYELLSLQIPGLDQTAANVVDQLQRSTGQLTVGNESYTLQNFRVSGPSTIKSQPSPYAPVREGEAKIWSPPQGYPEIQVWTLYAEVYSNRIPTFYRYLPSKYVQRKVGALYGRLLKKIDTNVYYATGAATATAATSPVRWPGPESERAILDGQLTLWQYRYRTLATGLLGGSTPPILYTPQSPASPPAVNLDDLNKR